MDRDIRHTEAFHEAQRFFEEACGTGQGSISDIAALQLSSKPSRLLFTGTMVGDLDTPFVTRICEIDLETASVEIITAGPHSDRHARISPDRTTIAFLSDRHRVSDFQLFFLDVRTRAVTAGPVAEGWVEYLEWSFDSRRLLLGVAGHGAELSSGEGAYKTKGHDGEPSWMPHIMGPRSDAMRRGVFILDVGEADLSCAVAGRGNVWEATWCGQDRLAVITSAHPEEGAWYGAELAIVELSTGITQSIYKPPHQIALPRVAMSGDHLAFVEAVASDRGFVAGDLRLYDFRSGTCRALATGNVDISSVECRPGDLILAAGHRGLETVVLLINAITGASKELWTSTRTTTSGDYATVIGLDQPEDFAFVCESFFQRPQISSVKSGTLEVMAAKVATSGSIDYWGEAETVEWQAPDGLRIEGWLLRPEGEPPYPTILHIHDGPVFHWRPHWLGRTPLILMLLRRGYAVFMPNPRGSSGCGQAFAAKVIGDIGGADTGDFLSGIDHLVSLGIADKSRLGVMGLSYGGLMTCWLTTQDSRFGAAIAVGPATNHVSHHLSCNIPQFVGLFLQDHYTNLGGAYYSRSPILQAHKSKTPTMLVCGTLDRCTPAEEAIQFHNALLENGVESMVVDYPEEGHGVRAMPAKIDFAARCAMWFDRHIGREQTLA